MKKFKFLSLLLIALMALNLAACSAPEPEASSMDLTEETEVVVVEETAEFDLDSEINAYFTNLPKNNNKISQVEFVEKVTADEDMFILDIRTAEDYQAGHIAGAVNAPWGTAISDSIKYIPQDKPVFVYCYSGQTAGQTVMTLNLAGLDARSVNLGWNFGISKVEAVEAVTSTDVVAFGEETFEIQPEVQTALDAYYAGLADVKETNYKNYKISEDNLKAMIDNKDDFYLLSIRSGDDFASGHIAGANNLPWGVGMEAGFESLPMDKEIVVYCYTGQTAGQTVAALRLLGYEAVSLNGGMGMASNAPIGWSNKGFDVVESSALESKINAYFADKPDNNHKIKQAEFVQKVADSEEMFVLDLRTAEDYEAGHVKGAFNSPWGTAISDNLKKMPQDKPVFVYCYSGQTAGQAVMTLNLAGFDARSVNLGWNFGISKVDGIDAVTETTVNAFTDTMTDIDPAVQTALDGYYAGLADVKETTYKNYKISEDNLKAMIDGEEDFYLLSIRSDKDFAEGHIAGANNLPWSKGMEAGFINLPKDEKIVVYCYTGQTAGQTVAGLKLLGYDAVSLNGGMGMESNAPLGWSNKEFDVVQ